MRLVAAVVLTSLLAQAGAHAADPSALWNIVNGKCVPHEQAAHDPSPCAAVDLRLGFAVLKDLRGIAQFLLIPTVRIGGIGDPAILAPDATNYWDAAWKARSFVESRLRVKLPRDTVALAVNSALARTQNQLHIHIDCIRPDVRAVIKANLDKVTAAWTPFPVLLAGHTYQALRINQETLDGIDPFRVLADSNPAVRANMALNTLVLTGATFAGGTRGFVLLADRADLADGDPASGEQLQDHGCTVAKN